MPDFAIRTFNYSRAIIRLFSILPQKTVAQTIGKQLLRSGTSIGANYREAKNARSRAEFASKIGDCLKEAAETAYWLDLLHAEKIIPRTNLTRIRTETDELIAILVSTSKTLRTSKNPPKETPE